MCTRVGNLSKRLRVSRGQLIVNKTLIHIPFEKFRNKKKGKREKKKKEKNKEIFKLRSSAHGVNTVK